MNRRLVFAFVAILVMCNGSLAQSLPQLHKSNFPNASVTTGDLKITIRDASNGLFGGGPWCVEVEVENPGPAAASFNPERLSFVRTDGRQIDVLGVDLDGDNRVSARELLIVSKARSKQSYILSAKLELPATMYYRGAAIAELTE